MNNERPRRQSTIPFASNELVPSAPPLPAPRPLQRAKDAASRLLRYGGSRPPSPTRNESINQAGRGRLPSLSSTKNVTAIHKTGLEINTIAINEAGTHALIGGKEIFKTIKVEDGVCAEELNLRSAIRSTPNQASGKPRQIYTIDIADVAWAKGDCGAYVAAATSSGKIILYDHGHAGLQAAQLHEHARQVHRVTFNPHRGSLLLSGSQDGTVRLWDVRDVRQANTLRSKHKYSGQADGIRDVKWSPAEGYDFAFGTDSGWLQRWDMRNLKTAKVKISAHIMTCNAIDWHPDGKHIASASADKTVRVWDVSVNQRRKASYEIKTPFAVSNARWRPACETSNSYDSGSLQCSQIITAYDAVHAQMHLWDFRRPSLPFRELAPNSGAPTDLLWHSQDLLWTVGKEGTFVQTDIQYAQKTIANRNLQAFAVSNRDEINIVTQRRRRQRGIRSKSINQSRRKSDNDAQTPGATLSRSWADDSLDHSFLSITPIKHNNRHAGKSRSQSLGMTVPSSDSRMQQSPAYLDDILSHRRTFRPQQTAGRGSLRQTATNEMFCALARKLTWDINPLLSHDDFLTSLAALLKSNSDRYLEAGQYRLAQTWTMIRHVLIQHMKERAQSRQTCTQVSPSRRVTRNNGLESRRDTVMPHLQAFASPQSLPREHKPVSSIARQLARSEVASSQRTPQVRPSADLRFVSRREQQALPELDDDQLNLPPQVLSKANDATIGQNSEEVRLTQSNLDDHQKRQRDPSIDKTDMVRRWSMKPAEAAAIGLGKTDGIWIPPTLQKHDSNESFAFLEDSFGSRGPSFPSSYASQHSGSDRQHLVSERPSKVKQITTDGTKGVQTHDFGTEHEVKALTTTSGTVLNEAPNERMDSSSAVVLSSPEIGYFDGVGPGSYPDENGISPLLELSRTRQRDANGRSGREIMRSQDCKNDARDLRDPSPSKLSVQRSASFHPDSSSSLYMPRDDDLDIEIDKPFSIREMLLEVVTSQARYGDAQTASNMLLLIVPLLPQARQAPGENLAATIQALVSSLASVGFNADGMEQVLDEHLAPILGAGLQPLQIEAIYEAYHNRLQQYGLMVEASHLRNRAYPAFPAVYEQALKDNVMHFKCGSCGKPMSNGSNILACEICSQQQAHCPICWCATSPFVSGHSHEVEQSRLATSCLLCNHGGHAACMRMWFVESTQRDGGCPTPGCLCDCTIGAWRTLKTNTVSRPRRARTHTRVKSDDWAIGDSKAVETTRDVLGVGRRNDPPALVTTSA